MPQNNGENSTRGGVNTPLMIGGALSVVAALLHFAVIAGGPDWYRFFGAGEDLATLAAQGSWIPPVMTVGIAAVLLSWGLYAFSGAGKFRRLPFLRLALVLITAVYLLRGSVVVPIWLFLPDEFSAFWVWSSVICLVYGSFYAIGTRQVWGRLSNRS